MINLVGSSFVYTEGISIRTSLSILAEQLAGMARYKLDKLMNFLKVHVLPKMLCRNSYQQSVAKDPRNKELGLQQQPGSLQQQAEQGCAWSPRAWSKAGYTRHDKAGWLGWWSTGPVLGCDVDCDSL